MYMYILSYLLVTICVIELKNMLRAFRKKSNPKMSSLKSYTKCNSQQENKVINMKHSFAFDIYMKVSMQLHKKVLLHQHPPKLLNY